MARVTPRLEPRDHGVDRRGPSPPRPARPLLGRGPGSGRGSRPAPGRRGARRRGARPGGRRRAGGHRPSWSRPPPPLPPSRPPAELLDGDRPPSASSPMMRITAVLGHVGEPAAPRRGPAAPRSPGRFDFPVLGSPTIAAIASGRKLASRSERNPPDVDRGEPGAGHRALAYGATSPRRNPHDGHRVSDGSSAAPQYAHTSPPPCRWVVPRPAQPESPSITRTTAPAISSSSQPP